MFGQAKLPHLFALALIGAICLVSCRTGTEKDEAEKLSSKEPQDSSINQARSNKEEEITHQEAADSLSKMTKWGKLEDSLDEFTGYREIGSVGTRPIFIEKGPGSHGAGLMTARYAYFPDKFDDPLSVYMFFVMTFRSSERSISCIMDMSFSEENTLEKDRFLADGERIAHRGTLEEPVEREDMKDLICPKVFTFKTPEETEKFRKIAYADTVRLRSGKYTFTIPRRSRLDMRKIWNRVH